MMTTDPHGLVHHLGTEENREEMLQLLGANDPAHNVSLSTLLSAMGGSGDSGDSGGGDEVTAGDLEQFSMTPHSGLKIRKV